MPLRPAASPVKPVTGPPLRKETNRKEGSAPSWTNSHTEQSKADQRQRRIRAAGENSRNARQYRDAAHDADPFAGPQNGHAALDERSGDESASEVAEIGGDKRNPGEDGNLLKTETPCVTEVLRQPEHIEPPDRVSQGSSDDDGPGFAPFQQGKPGTGAGAESKASLSVICGRLRG